MRRLHATSDPFALVYGNRGTTNDREHSDRARDTGDQERDQPDQHDREAQRHQLPDLDRGQNPPLAGMAGSAVQGVILLVLECL